MNLNSILQPSPKRRKVKFKTALKMKLTAVLLFTATLQICATGLAQRVNLKFKNDDITTVFREIEKQTNFSFVYSQEQLLQTKKINLTLHNEKLEVALQLIFKGQPLMYTILGNHIILKEKAKNPNNSKSPILPVQKQVKGKVSNVKGEPIPGANIHIKGSTEVVETTDAEGNFSINVPDNTTILVVSYLGMETLEVTIGDAPLTIVLKETGQKLDDVVVVGYGKQKKVNLTGAIASVSGETLERRVSPNSAALLQGVLPGLQVIQGSGQPGGEGVQFLVRGMNSYGSSNDPLILVDGIPGGMPTADNIASVTLLKDAASAAIYGVRAANGVIIVTTKRGKAGTSSLIYSVNTAHYEATKTPDLITNSADFMQLWNQAAIHSNSEPSDRYQQADIDKYRASNGNDPRYPNTNWMDLIFKDAIVTNHSLTATGGNEKTTYNLNFNYLSEPGVVAGHDFKRFTSRLNVETKISNVIKAGVNVSLGYSKTLTPAGDLLLSAFTQSPTYGPFLPDGSGRLTKYAFSAIEFKNNRNPFVILGGGDVKATGMSAQLNPYLQFNFTDWLTLDINASVNSSYSKNKAFSSPQSTYDWTTGKMIEQAVYPGFTGQGLQVTDASTINPLVYSTLNFHKTFNKHSVGALIGLQHEYYKSDFLRAYRPDYTSDLVQEIDAGGLSGIQNGGSAAEYALSSYFGRVNYSYDNKYLLEVNLRADGSSRFAPGYRWGYFPSVSAGWRVLQEEFIPKVSWFNEFKLRASYGKLGNQGTNNYPYQSVLGTSGLYSYDNTTINTGLAPLGLVNREISWEETKVLDFGVDLGFMQNKLLLTFDWYKKETDGILRPQQVTFETGFSTSAPIINEGSMANTGYELTIDYHNKIGEFNYGINWNIQHNKNEVTKFGAEQINASPYSPRIIKEGIPYNSYYMYTWDGIFQTQAEADASGQSNKPKAGDLKMKDISGPNGVPDGKIDGNDKTVIGGMFPDFSTGLTLTASYKNFDISAFFYGAYGQKSYVYGPGFEPFYQGSVPTKDWLNAWTPENHSTTMPAAYNSQRYNSTWSTYPNTWFLKDASYTRLKSLNIGYTMAEDIFKKGIIKSVRVYLAGENLFTITDYEGLDPERAMGGGNYLTYPQNRIYSMGAIIKL